MGDGINQIMCKQSAAQENIAGFFENGLHCMLFIITVEDLEVFQYAIRQLITLCIYNNLHLYCM